jgi:type III secretory pathway component EscS
MTLILAYLAVGIPVSLFLALFIWLCIQDEVVRDIVSILLIFVAVFLSIGWGITTIKNHSRVTSTQLENKK